MTFVGRFATDALRVLESFPGLTVIAGAKAGSDAVVHFSDTQVSITIEFKTHVNSASAWQFVRLAERNGKKPLLVVAKSMTADARRILTEHDVAFLDGRGNAHIELPGLLFHLEGHGRAARPPCDIPPTRLGGKAGVVAQALLLDPERDWQVQDLAETAGVAKGLAHRVLARLDREEIMESQGTGPKRRRRLANPTALFDLWAEEQTDQPTRISGHLLAQTSQQLMRDVGSRLNHAGIEHAFTGAAGASLVAPFVTSIPVVEVRISASAISDAVFRAVKAEPVPDGQNIVFLQGKDDTSLAFREQVKNLWVGNRFRLYADLRRNPLRGREQADHLRREVIKL